MQVAIADLNLHSRVTQCSHPLSFSQTVTERTRASSESGFTRQVGEPESQAC